MSEPAKKIPTVSDAALMERLRDGDLGALGALFDRYHADVRRIVSRLGVPAGDVDDLVQLAFLDAMRSAAAYDGRASAKPWLSGIAVMIVRRHRRSLGRLLRRLTTWASEPADEGPTSPERSAELSQEALRAQRALERLSEKKRQVFVLVSLEGLSGEEVARALGIPVATVWTRLHHARRELRESLSQEES